MSMIKKPGRLLGALVALALALSGPFGMSAGLAAPQSADAKGAPARADRAAALTARTPRAVDSAEKRGDVVQIAADSWTGEFAQLSPVALNGKIAWGTRITIPTEVAPFTLTGIIAVILEYQLQDGTPVGLQVGEPIELLVFSDASASGVIGNAKLIYRENETVKTFDPDMPALEDVLYTLDTPVTVSQGDLYLVVADRTTNTDENGNTVIPQVAQEDGGANSDRAFVAFASAATNASSYIDISDTNFAGEWVVRAVGEQAAADAEVTNDLEPTDETLPAPTNLTGTGTGTGGTLTWTAPNLPPPTITDTNEQESNNSPATAQNVGVNVRVAGDAGSAENGADGGFGGDDIEDWYAFTLTSSTTVTIDLSDFGNTDFDLLLYSSNGPFSSDSALATSGLGAGEDEHIDILLGPGTYLVAVSAFDDPPIPNGTDYTLQIVAAPKVLRYNIYCGVGAATISDADYYGSAPGDATSFIIQRSTPGAAYIVTAVIGGSQTGPSNTANLGDCEGGPDITSVKKLKLKKQGKLSLNGSGFVAGSTILINGAMAGSKVKVKKGGTQLDIKGPLANGNPLSSVITSGQEFTVTIITPTGGCSTATFTAP